MSRRPDWPTFFFYFFANDGKRGLDNLPVTDDLNSNLLGTGH